MCDVDEGVTREAPQGISQHSATLYKVDRYLIEMTYVFLRQSARGIPVLIGTLICARFPKRPYYSTRGQLVHIYSGIVRSLIQERAIKSV